MPLVLSMHEDDDFYVGDDRFVVTRIYDETSFSLLHEGADKRFEITEDQATEVVPDVFVSAGDLFQKGIVRAVIEAPREVLILRGDKYRSSADFGG